MWADVVRDNSDVPDLGNLLEAAARLQLGEIDAARGVARRRHRPDRPVVPGHRQHGPPGACARGVSRRQRRGGDARSARRCSRTDPYSPDVWDAFARLVRRDRLRPDRRWSRGSPTTRRSKCWRRCAGRRPTASIASPSSSGLRNPGDPRCSRSCPSFAARLDSLRAMEWSARMRARRAWVALCPLLERAEDERVGAAERARAAALAHASFGDTRAREAARARGRRLSPDDELGRRLRESWTIAPMLTDSVVVRGRDDRRCGRCGSRRLVRRRRDQRGRTRCSCTACRSTPPPI